jgi:hypothetical protein
LPYIEQAAIYEQLRQLPAAENPSDRDVPAGSPKAAILNAFLCPADGNGKTKPAAQCARTNYRMNGGDYPVSISMNNTVAGNTPYIGLGRGVFGYMTRYNLSVITDGTSNTALYSERCVHGGNDDNRLGNLRVKESAVFNYDGGIWSGENQNAAVIDRSACLNTRDGNNYKNPLTGITYPNSYDAWDGGNYCDGHFWLTSFRTVLPPNAPSCVNRVNRDISIITPSSNHTGGVQLALADGSVRFISESIDTGTAIAASKTGKSPFGVWGALGSRNGDEAVSPP